MCWSAPRVGCAVLRGDGIVGLAVICTHGGPVAVGPVVGLGAVARGGWLRLNFLTIDGCRIAFHYSVRSANKLYLLKPGYDPRYARYSPSNLLCYHVLQDGFRHGLVEYDFLGASDPWKLDWTKETRPHHWLYVFSDALRGRLLYQAKFHLIAGPPLLVELGIRPTDRRAKVVKVSD